MSEPTGPSFYAMAHEGKVSLHFFAGVGQGLSTNVDLTPEKCQRLIDLINETLAKLPRIGTAADLGLETLP